MTPIVRDAVGYLIVSGCALAVDVAFLTALVSYLSWWYVAAASLSFSIGVVVAYVLSITLVFRHRSLHEPRLEFTGFAVIGVIGLGINSAVIFISVNYIGLYYLTAKAVAAVFTFSFNFLARRQLFETEVSV